MNTVMMEGRMSSSAIGRYQRVMMTQIRGIKSLQSSHIGTHKHTHTHTQRLPGGEAEAGEARNGTF